MSEPPSGTSSGAPQRSVETLVRCDDALDGRWLGSRIPLVELECPAEDDAIGPREHVARPSGEGIIHFRLRLEDRELPTRRMQILVAEQIAAPEAGAVEHQVFGERSDVRRSRELADFELAACNLDVADHLAEV